MTEEFMEDKLEDLQGEPQPDSPADTEEEEWEQAATYVDEESEFEDKEENVCVENEDNDTEAADDDGDSDFVYGDEDLEVTMESVIEAVLFASDEPVSINKLASVVETGSRQVRQYMKDLNKKYRENGISFRIEKIAGGYQMMTLPEYNNWLRKLIKARSDNKLSSAAMETLAIISYKQPIIRADVESIRGVSSGEMIRNLMSKGLVKITGRAEMLGRPMLYGTTKKFLEVFGLNSLKDLPKIEELKKPTEKSPEVENPAESSDDKSEDSETEETVHESGATSGDETFDHTDSESAGNDPDSQFEGTESDHEATESTVDHEMERQTDK